ncbi:VWA domain-containing protein [Lusitaniella coriacea]|nr:VWA domain-containing protein [Lusitaniella coriacea]
MKLRQIFFATTLSLGLLLSPSAAFAKAKIQIAILLDSSNSMDGLIDQTRTQLWEIVNALTSVTKDGEIPELEVALYHYGNDHLPSQEGFLTLLNGFTSELDLVSEKLFSIDTNGGQEYAGWVINSALKELNWSAEDENFRVIFIAGNEPFDQGPVDWKDSVETAANRDILVNTIYCGNPESEDRTFWVSGAQAGQGDHFNINHNRTVTFIESPYDADIALWNQRLNETYIPYGIEGEIGQERQQVEDANAGTNIASRGASKASGYYRNASWDLVDALDEERVQLAELTDADLPEAMQGMTLAQKREYVAQRQEERARIQAILRDLNQKRADYVAQQTQANSEGEDTLDSVTIQALRQQLTAKGFEFQ